MTGFDEASFIMGAAAFFLLALVFSTIISIFTAARNPDPLPLQWCYWRADDPLPEGWEKAIDFRGKSPGFIMIQAKESNSDRNY